MSLSRRLPWVPAVPLLAACAGPVLRTAAGAPPPSSAAAMDVARPCPVAAAFVDSHGALADTYRFADHVAAFRHCIDVVATLPCELLVMPPHSMASNLQARFNGDAPLIDAGACRRFAESERSDLAGRLAGEVEAGTP